jgi:hypothetical protein
MDNSLTRNWNHLCGIVRRSALRHAFLLPSQAERFDADAQVFCDMPAPQSDGELRLRQVIWDKLLESWGRVLTDAGQRPTDEITDMPA